jgi:hypothetical protein
MPAAIYNYGPSVFLNFDGKLFSQKHEHLVFVKFPALHGKETVMGAWKRCLEMIFPVVLQNEMMFGL